MEIMTIFVKTNLNTMAKKQTNNELIIRMAQVRSKWKFKSHTPIYEAYYGKLTDKERKHIHAVWSLHSIDELVVKQFEKILED